MFLKQEEPELRKTWLARALKEAENLLEIYILKEMECGGPLCLPLPDDYQGTGRIFKRLCRCCLLLDLRGASKAEITELTWALGRLLELHCEGRDEEFSLPLKRARALLVNADDALVRIA